MKRYWFPSIVLTMLIPLSGATAVAASVPTLKCGSDVIHVTWRGTTGGLAGSGGDLFWVRNTGDVACTVRGYPKIAFAGARHGAMRTEDVAGHLGKDEFGVRPGESLPTVRIAPHGGIASFWVFGNDIMSPCTTATRMMVSISGLVGRAVVNSPPMDVTWPFCGVAVVVNPLLAGASGSDPPVALGSVLLR